MADIVSVHDALYEAEWSLENIRMILQRDSSSVNEVKGFETPLDRVLTDRRCSIALVKLLLYYGADPNFTYCRGSPSPLIRALYSSDKVEIIKALVEAGM